MVKLVGSYVQTIGLDMAHIASQALFLASLCSYFESLWSGILGLGLQNMVYISQKATCLSLDLFLQ